MVKNRTVTPKQTVTVVGNKALASVPGTTIIPPYNGAAAPASAAPAVAAQPAAVVAARPSPKILRPSGFSTVVIPASPNANFLTTSIVQMAGNRFTILQSNLPVKIQPLPGGRNETYYQGMGNQFQEPFNGLIVTNPSLTSQLVMRIYVGFDDIFNYTAPLLPAAPFDNFTAIAVTNTPQPLSATDQWFRKGIVFGYSAAPNGAAPSNNNNLAYIGKTAANQPEQLAQGLYLPYEAPAGEMFNLANIYVLGTAGDGVFFQGSL
jgi:hypothetical protein